MIAFDCICIKYWTYFLFNPCSLESRGSGWGLHLRYSIPHITPPWGLCPQLVLRHLPHLIAQMKGCVFLRDAAAPGPSCARTGACLRLSFQGWKNRKSCQLWSEKPTMGPTDCCQRELWSLDRVLRLGGEKKRKFTFFAFPFFNSAAVNLLRKRLQAVCKLLSREIGSVILVSLVCQT